MNNPRLLMSVLSRVLPVLFLNQYSFGDTKINRDGLESMWAFFKANDIFGNSSSDKYVILCFLVLCWFLGEVALISVFYTLLK